MQHVKITDPPGVRVVPDRPTGTGALVLAGSSGRVDADRAHLLAAHGCLAESIRWFGAPGQQPGPWEVPVELFTDRVTALRGECDRVVLVGTSFGAEAALLVATLSTSVDAIIAFAPSDVVWAGVTPQGCQTSHWASGGRPVPFVPFDESWAPDDDPPSFLGLYEASRTASPERVPEAAIPVERIPEVLCVAGGDDRVWPSVAHAESIRRRRAAAGLTTGVVTLPGAGHRAVLPGETAPAGGARMRRGGTDQDDRALGALAWDAMLPLL